MRSRTFSKKITAFAAALVMAATSAYASPGAFADPYELPVVPAKNVPAKYDLRNVNGMNYVTPVKYQGEFQSCWAFAANAAAETNILFANGMGVRAGTENNAVDLSEKYAAWYTFAKITDGDTAKGVIPQSQVGEGLFDADDAGSGYDVYMNGGTIAAALKLYANGMGPVREQTTVGGREYFGYFGANKWVFPNPDAQGAELEAEADYVYKTLSDQDPDYSREKFDKDWADKDKRKELVSDAQGALVRSYAAYDDWSLPDTKQYRMSDQAAVLKQFKIFGTFRTTDESGEAVFNDEALEAIKKEISDGHAMACQVYGDGGADPSVMNTQNQAQYIARETEDIQSNHGVTIVGYDDKYSKMNFARDNDEDGRTDADSIPPKDGAFIIKNSYGCITAEDEATAVIKPDGTKEYSRPGVNAFGIGNSGFYYVSYYDATLEEYTSVDFFKAKEQKAANTDQYDLLSVKGALPMVKAKSRSANIFTAEQDEYLQEIGLSTFDANTKAEYSIYKDPKGSDPTTGTLLESGTKSFSEKGFYRFDLKKQHFINAGSKYAVVVKLSAKSGDETIVSAAVPVAFEGTAVINSGESVVELGGKWSDLTKKEDEVKQNVYDTLVETMGAETVEQNCPDGKDSIIIDNFAIKGYTTPAAVRFAGNNRYDTAAKISGQSGLFEKSDVVVIANATDFADALAGVPLAAAYNAPILLTGRDKLADETAAEIKRLGAGTAVILGGTGAVSEKAEAAIRSAGCKNIQRIAGATRFETAVNIAKALSEKTGKAASEAFFVVYNNFADALSASTAAAIKGAPIIYVPQKTDIDKATAEFIGQAKGGIKNAYVIGGEGVIPEKIRKDLGVLLGGKTVERIAGANRYATCCEVNKKFAELFTGEGICIAKGLDFPDALAGGVYAALTKSPMMLADKQLTADAIAYLEGSSAAKAAVFGGTGAVSESIVSQVYRYLKNA